MRDAKNRRGQVVVISGPSGCGKTTVCKRLCAECGYVLSVSATTREPRAGERDGTDYHFLRREAFEDGVKRDDFLESAEHFGHFYGTLRRPVDEAVAAGQVIVLEIDVNGARQVMDKLPDAMSVFLTAPDQEELRRRLAGRQTEDDQAMRRRLARVEREMAQLPRYGSHVVNHKVSQTVSDLRDLIEKTVSAAAMPIAAAPK